MINNKILRIIFFFFFKKHLILFSPKKMSKRRKSESKNPKKKDSLRLAIFSTVEGLNTPSGLYLRKKLGVNLKYRNKNSRGKIKNRIIKIL